MAQKVIFPSLPSQTLVCKLVDDDNQPFTYDFTSSSVVEEPALSGVYVATFDPGGIITGNYRLCVLASNIGVAQFDVDFQGQFGEMVNAVEFTGDTTINPNEVAAAVWDASLASYQNPGSTGEGLSDAGGGGGTNPVVVYPVISNSPQRTNETTLKAYIGESSPFDVAVVDAQGNPVDTTGMTLQVTIEDRQTNDVEVIADGAITKTATSYSFTTVTSNTTLGQKTWSCRNIASGDLVISTGNYVVSPAPN